MKAILRALLSVALCLGALTVTHPASAAPDENRKVTVFTTADEPVAEFTTAKCRQSHGNFVALTPAVNGYRMFVSIDTFTGFHIYDLVRGNNADPYVSIMVNGEAAFSTLYVPPFPVPGFGQVRFSPKGRIMGVGFQPMFNQAGTDGVIFAGALKCQYRKKRR